MPLGNGEIGINAWVDKSGDLSFYIARTDSWGDNGRLLKIGKIRISFDPALDLTCFEQTLSLVDATIVVRCGTRDEPDALTLRFWVDAEHPVINLTVDAPQPLAATATIELWRTEPTELDELEVSDINLDRSRPDRKRQPTIVEPDTLLSDQTDRIGWFHHNIKSVGPALTAELQGLSDFERPNPLLHRTFGAVVELEEGEGQRLDERQLLSPPSTSHTFCVTVVTRHPATPAEWLAAVDETIAAVEAVPATERRQAHEDWWRQFWERSWIHVSGSPDADPEAADDAAVVSQSYALQRYLQACSGRGHFPIRYNGSIFTVPYPDTSGDADYRRWGSGWWWQNIRLPYFSMCAAGDFEMMAPLFKLYARDHFELWRHRTRTYFGHDGIFFSECVYFWGDVFTETYGWTPFAEREDPLQESGYHKWEWVGGLELIWLMLDYFDHTGDATFLQQTALPFAEQILLFLDEFYDTNEEGELVIHPSQALETWWDCTNPMDMVSGARAVTARLLALPQGELTADRRATWKAFENKIPELPTHEVDGVPMLAPAQAFADERNVENAELYAVFPFRLVSAEKPNAPLGIAALEARSHGGHFGWRQDDLFMAYLGLAPDTQAAIVSRARHRDHDALGRSPKNYSRFPAFWGPNYDWYPDQTHGGVLAATLQAMVVQHDGERIFLLPAWPENWDAEFKLHAPGQTVISGQVRAGELVEWDVTPSARRADVTVVQ